MLKNFSKEKHTQPGRCITGANNPQESAEKQSYATLKQKIIRLVVHYLTTAKSQTKHSNT